MVIGRSKHSFAACFAVVILLLLASTPSECHTRKATGAFTVPEWTSMRIRLNTTLTSQYSQLGDPFSATVVDRGPYEGARVYGRVSSIRRSGHIRGSTTMVLRFTSLRMPDGRRAGISTWRGGRTHPRRDPQVNSRSVVMPKAMVSIGRSPTDLWSGMSPRAWLRASPESTQGDCASHERDQPFCGVCSPGLPLGDLSALFMGHDVSLFISLELESSQAPTPGIRRPSPA